MVDEVLSVCCGTCRHYRIKVGASGELGTCEAKHPLAGVTASDWPRVELIDKCQGWQMERPALTGALDPAAFIEHYHPRMLEVLAHPDKMMPADEEAMELSMFAMLLLILRRVDPGVADPHNATALRQRIEALEWDVKERELTIAGRDSKIAQLLEQVATLQRWHEGGRANIEFTEEGIRLCRGLHGGTDPCDWVHYVARPDPDTPAHTPASPQGDADATQVQPEADRGAEEGFEVDG